MPRRETAGSRSKSLRRKIKSGSTGATTSAGAGRQQQQTRLTLTVKTALDVLRCFTSEQPVRGVNEIALLLGISKSSVSRLLATLEEEQIVRRALDSDRYQLGLGLLDLAGVLINQLDVRSAALPHLRALTNTTQEAVSLAVLDGVETVLVEHLSSPSPHPIGYFGRIGHRTPAYCSSGGKALLAFVDEEQLRPILTGAFRQYTSHTLTSGDALLAQLAEVRLLGYSVNRAEYWEGVAGVGAPIFDIHGAPVAAVSVVGPSLRFPEPRIQELGALARKTASDISRSMGVPAAPPKMAMASR